ncbi:hypothetical protein WMY93_003021 [Mugilogobius chulae]|uniref:CUE domain-containing protein n=1 Tax=Mugilogobius chulae TaxID=88201 RepID=A0AAW0Q3Q9_9GOBI
MTAIDKCLEKRRVAKVRRVPSGLQLEGATNTGYRAPPMASNFLPGSSSSSPAKEDILRNMQEVFSHLDPEVIYIVLSECDFKAENAMDALLELSVAAADPQPAPPSVSGFERTAEALLNPHDFAELQSQNDQSTHLECSPTSPTCIMTEDLDFLIDQEVQSLSAQGSITGQQVDSETTCLTEDLQFKSMCSGTSTEKSLSLQSLQNSRTSSPLDQLSTFEDLYNVVDERVPTEFAEEKSRLSVDLIMYIEEY